MVKLALVGRMSDGLPLSQTPMYLDEDEEASSIYRWQGELLLKEISRGALSHPRMSILMDHHYFHYLVEDGVCYLVFCNSQYPRKLAFHYLQDLQKEFKRVEPKLMESFSKPYEFTRFDYVMGNIRKKYLDTRTQANLSKLNSDRQQDLDIATEEFSNVIDNGRTSGTEARIPDAVLQTDPAFWNSKLLEVIALKWTPITMIVIVAALLLYGPTSSSHSST